MAQEFALLGALVATKNLSWDDAQNIAAFCEYAKEICTDDDLPCLEAGIDLALDFFNDDPDEEAALEAARISAVHDDGTCPDCGGPMYDGPDESDFEQAMELWSAVRGIADKYAFDRCDFSDHAGRGEAEEC